MRPMAAAVLEPVKSPTVLRPGVTVAPQHLRRTFGKTSIRRAVAMTCGGNDLFSHHRKTMIMSIESKLLHICICNTNLPLGVQALFDTQSQALGEFSHLCAPLRADINTFDVTKLRI